MTKTSAGTDRSGQRSKVKKIQTVRTWIGIDPGVTGGIVTITEDPDYSQPIVFTAKMPETPRDIWSLVAGLSRHNKKDARKLEDEGKERRVFCLMERLWGCVGKENSGPSMFKFGTNYGMLQMALTAARIQFDDVIPRKWQQAMGIAPRKRGIPGVNVRYKKPKMIGETQTAFKARIRDKAQDLFPDLEVTLRISDALLIAEYAHRTVRL